VIVAGRPSMGQDLARHEHRREARPSGSKLPGGDFQHGNAGRAAGDAHDWLRSGASTRTRVRTGKLEDDDWPRLTHAIGGDAGTRAPMFIDDTPALTRWSCAPQCAAPEAVSTAWDMIVVDYLQLMQAPGIEREPAPPKYPASRVPEGLAKARCAVLPLCASPEPQPAPNAPGDVDLPRNPGAHRGRMRDLILFH